MSASVHISKFQCMNRRWQSPILEFNFVIHGEQKINVRINVRTLLKDV